MHIVKFLFTREIERWQRCPMARALGLTPTKSFVIINLVLKYTNTKKLASHLLNFRCFKVSHHLYFFKN